MSDLAGLEQRIRAALERMDAGIERLTQAPAPGVAPGAAPGATEEIAHLQALLDAERNARAAAEVELSAYRNAAPADDSARLLRQIDAQSLDNQRLRASVATLREEVRRLSEALAEGLADPAALNHALLAEVESLRAQRASETTEMADILAELNRIVTAEERAHA